MSYEHIYICEDCGGYPHNLPPQAYDDIPECTCPDIDAQSEGYGEE